MGIKRCGDVVFLIFIYFWFLLDLYIGILIDYVLICYENKKKFFKKFVIMIKDRNRMVNLV